MFVPDWRAVLLRAHSTRALFLLALLVAIPDILFAVYALEVDPYLRGQLFVLGIAYGLLGRIIRQDIDGDGRADGPWLFGLVVILAAVMVWVSIARPAVAMADPVRVVEPVAQVEGAGVAPDEAFLKVAVPFVGEWEGLRLQAYLDPVGIPTVCYGETKDVRMGDIYTKAECDAMLARELLDYRARLHRHFTAETLAHRLPVPRDVAYGSLAYNVGVGAAGGSTAVKRLNAGDIAGGCEALTWWNKAGGRVWAGLVRRRGAEFDLCMQGLSA